MKIGILPGHPLKIVPSSPPLPVVQVREATAFLLEALAGDRPDQAALQTKLLEINLITNPQVGWNWLESVGVGLGE